MTGTRAWRRLSTFLAQLREEPWPMHPLRDLSVPYRVSFVVTLLLTVGTIIPIIGAVGGPGSVDDGSYLGFIVMISCLLGLFVFRVDETTTIDYINVVPMALIVAGRPFEAIVSIVVVNIATPVRKPIVPHLVVANLCYPAWVVGVTSLVFDRARGGAVPLDERWMVAGAAALVAYAVLEFVVFMPIMVFGGYESVRDALDGWRTVIKTHLLSTTPTALLIGVVLTSPSRWYVVFLLTSFAATYELFARTDKLVEAKVEASTDPLTGLFNRRSLQTHLGRVVEAATRQDSQDVIGSWVLLCDLDNFKRLNDTRGHDVGDQALVAAAAQLRASVRTTDFAARFGGEEFVAVIENVPRDVAAEIADRLRGSIEDHLAEFGTTVSVGVHRITGEDNPLTALNAADQAMYVSKTTGKNRVTYSSDMPGGAAMEVERAA